MESGRSWQGWGSCVRCSVFQCECSLALRMTVSALRMTVSAWRKASLFQFRNSCLLHVCWHNHVLADYAQSTVKKSSVEKGSLRISKCADTKIHTFVLRPQTPVFWHQKKVRFEFGWGRGVTPMWKTLRSKNKCELMRWPQSEGDLKKCRASFCKQQVTQRQRIYIRGQVFGTLWRRFFGNAWSRWGQKKT